MESWLQLLEAPPPPSDFGLNDDSTRLELITEFLTSPAPRKTTVITNGQADDLTLSWTSQLKTPSGIAFKIGNRSAIHVRKQWITMENRQCLIESVDYSRAKTALTALPAANHASLAPSSRFRHIAALKRELPKRIAATVQRHSSLRIAKTSDPKNAFLVDYSIVASGGPTTFAGGTTYLVTNGVSLTGTTVIEGGAVIKFSTNSDAKISVDSLDCRTGPYSPAVFTSIMDNSVGDPVLGSTGNPSTNYCGDVALESSTPENCLLHDLRFSHLNAGFRIPSSKADGGSGSIAASNLQFAHCQSAFVTSDSVLTLFNSLFVDIGTLFDTPEDSDKAGQNYYGENLTVHRCGNFAIDYSGGYYFTNCLFVQTTNFHVAFSYQWHTNAIVNLSDDTGVFQSLGGGNHYLADDTYRTAGTRMISLGHLAQLRQKTTYPPVILTNTITTDTNLGIQASRDTNSTSVAVGYHYDPLDFVVSELGISGATLSVSNGATIALFVPADPDYVSSFLLSSATVNSEGTPTQPNRFVWYNTVQESTNSEWDPPSKGDPCIFGAADSGCVVNLRFTHFSVLDGHPSIFGDPASDWEAEQVTVRDCEFHHGGNSFFAQNYSGHAVTLSLTNCLFDRSGLNCYQMNYQMGPIGFENCLFYSNHIFLNKILTNLFPITFTNCMFDTTDITQTNNPAVAAAYNAYLTNNTHRLAPTNGNDLVLPMTAFPYATGALGNFYQPITNLMNQGYGNAGQFGLFHYTVLTNQVKESNTVTDIGYHYVSLDSNNNPDDLDGDGIPDYIADANGNGSFDPGETNWAQSMVIAWGDNSKGQCNVPTGLNDVIAVDGGAYYSLALRSDGSVVAWGDNGDGECNVPVGLRATAITAGEYHAVAVKPDSTVEQWGTDWASIPAGLSNVVSVSAGQTHTIALRSDHSAVAWGENPGADANWIPSTLAPLVAIAAGENHNIGIQTDGQVAAWGDTGDILGWHLLSVPADATNVVSIAVGALHSVAVRADGIAKSWGYNPDGQTNVPTAETNLIGAAAGLGFSLGLRSDGTVAAWGSMSVPDGLNSVTTIGAGLYHCLAVRAGRLTPYIIQTPQPSCVNFGANAIFNVSAMSMGPVTYQWQFNGADISGATSPSLTIANAQPANEGSYRVCVSNGAGSIYTASALLSVPHLPQLASCTTQTNWLLKYGDSITLNAYATNTNACSFPISYNFALNGLSDTAAFRTNCPISFARATDDGTYTVQITNAAGVCTNLSWTVHVAAEGSPIWWGSTTTNSWDTVWGMHDATALAAGGNHGLILRDNGSIVAYGANDFGQTNVPTSITNAISVAAGDSHSLALNADGTVVAWGRNDQGQTNVPANVTNAIAISAGGQQSLALLKDGTVIQWGQTFASAPTITNVIAISSGTNFQMALLGNGTVVAWGNNDYGQTTVPSNATNVVAIAAGGAHALAVRQDASVVAWGANTSGQATVPVSLTNAMSVAAGYSHSAVLRNDGTVYEWGDNGSGQTNNPSWMTSIKLLAVGGNQTVASMFYSLANYQIDPSKDLLLIYTSNSLDSSNVCSYYVQHRPMVSNANVLALNSLPAETVNRTGYTNTIRQPILDWLASNPAKRPKWWVLFLDVPSRINVITNEGVYPIEPPDPEDNSVSYELNSTMPANPLVMHINMNGTNDCIGYIDKLAALGTTASESVFLRPMTSYANTNYFVDNVRVSFGLGTGAYKLDGDIVSTATNGLIQAGVHENQIVYLDQIEPTVDGSEFFPKQPHLTNGVNVAGYISWGFHSSLGPDYATNINWSGDSGWWIIETIESQNGWRHLTSQGTFVKWFAPNAFGGTNYSNTPIGAATHTEEPNLDGVINPQKYFRDWAQGKSFGGCAWDARQKQFFQAIGDPFVRIRK